MSDIFNIGDEISDEDQALSDSDISEIPESPKYGVGLHIKNTTSAPAEESVDWLLDMADTSVQPKPWMKLKKFILGTTETMPRIIDECIASGRYAIDLETSGLDNRVFQMPDGTWRTQDRIAGVCLSPDGETGYYIPLHHVKIVEGVREELPCNIPLPIFATEMQRLVAATDTGKTVATFHNAKFDQEFLQFNETGKPWGEWDKAGTWHDTLIAAYMRNTRGRVKKLKKLAAAPPDADENHPCGGPGLGMEMFEIHELWGHDKAKKGFKYDFTTLDPSRQDVLWYACSDAICTWLLWPLLQPDIMEPASDGKTMAGLHIIEKLCVAATRWMERNRLHVDRDKVIELIGLGQKEWEESIEDVYKAVSELLGRDVMPPLYKTLKISFVHNDMANLLPQQIQIAESRNRGYAPGTVTKNEKDWPATYDIEAPAQLGVMFEELGIQGLKRSEKSDQVVTNKAELNRILDESGLQYPFLKKIKRFREVAKALSTYLYPMFLDTDPRDQTARISYQGHKIDTGRFATPVSDSDTTGIERSSMIGWPQLNIQAVPNTNATDRPMCMVRIRECFTARPVSVGKPPRFFVSIDFSGVELRIVTNLSREPKWLKEFFHCSSCNREFPAEPRPPLANGKTTKTPQAPPPRCPTCGSDKIGDLHTLTGIAIYGVDAPSRADWKSLRGDAKSLNFALCYGGGGAAVMRAIKSKEIDKNEGNRIARTFNETYVILKRWWDETHKFARQHRFVRTVFGRKYPVPDITNPDRGFQAKAERNSTNGPIQGGSADITKLAMALIYKECKRRGWLEKIMMVITMHDELCFEIDADIIEKAIPVLTELMNANEQLLGLNWPVPLTSDTEIGFGWDVPWNLVEMQHGEVRFNGNKKIKSKEKCPEGVDFDSLPFWPEALRPWFQQANGSPPPKADPSSGSGAVATSPLQIPAANMPIQGPAADVIKAAPIPLPASDIPPPGGEYLFRMRSPLTPRTAVALAELITECQNGGTYTLKLLTRDNQPIDGWLEHAGLSQIKIDARTFDILARKQKL